MRLIGLAGFAGSGKSAAAEYLARQHGFERVRFAGALKSMMRALLRDAGVPRRERERMIEGDLKEEPSDILLGRSPREAMQWLGTEWGRDLFGPDLWTSIALARIERILEAGGSVVIEDVRFINEVRAIELVGGVVVRMNGRGGIAGCHPSEREIPLIPAIDIDNTGSIRDLELALDEVSQRLAG